MQSTAGATVNDVQGAETATATVLPIMTFPMFTNSHTPNRLERADADRRDRERRERKQRLGTQRAREAAKYNYGNVLCRL